MKTVQEKISLLWIVVMFNMIFADILSFVIPGMMEQVINQTTDVPLTQPLLLVFAILLEIPIVLIVLSRTLSYKLNRWSNIIGAVITILFVVGGGSLYLHYIFFAGVEVICMVIIIILAAKWKEVV